MMIRNLKTLGLALVAICALSAVAASAASAQKFTASGEVPTTFTGVQSELNAFTFDSGELECEVATFEGEGESGATAVEVTPNYEECTAFGLDTEFNMTGCTYNLHANGETELKCEGEGEHVDVVAAFGLCTVTVYPGTYNHVSYTNGTDPNTEKEDVTVDITVSGITYEEHGPFCADETELKHNGTLTGQVTVTGQDKNGPVDVTWDEN